MKWVFFFPSIVVPFILGDIYKHAISFMGQLNFRGKKKGLKDMLVILHMIDIKTLSWKLKTKL